MSLVAKNVWTQDIVLKSLQTTLVMNENYDLDENHTEQEYKSSHALKHFVTNESVEIYENSQLLSVEDAIAALTLLVETGCTLIASGMYPPDDPVHGTPWINPNNSMIYIYDATRTLWLVSRFPLSFSIDGPCKNKYLEAPSQYSNTDGAYRIFRDAVICGVTIDIYIQKNGTTVGITPEEDYENLPGYPEFILENQSEGWKNYREEDLNIQLDEDLKLQMYCWANKNVKYAHVVLDMAWRYSE